MAEEKEEKISKMITVELSEEYWVIVLTALEKACEKVASYINDLRELGYTQEDIDNMPDGERTALAGTLLAKATIIDVLVENGVMTAEASKLGLKAIKEKLKKAGFLNTKQ